MFNLKNLPSFMSQTLFEKLQLEDGKNLLIQGLPSTIEKQFSKLSFSKNATPLLKTRGIDFALIFALNSKQLYKILADVCPALKPDGKLWIAFPKVTSKITSDLNRDCDFEFLTSRGFEPGEKVGLDYVWNALLFTKNEFCDAEKSQELGSTARKKVAAAAY